MTRLLFKYRKFFLRLGNRLFLFILYLSENIPEMVGSGTRVYPIIDELKKEPKESDDEVHDDYDSYKRIESASRWGKVHEKHDREDGCGKKSEETSVYGEENVAITGEDFREQGSGENIYKDMEEEREYEKIWFHEIDIDVEWRHEDEKEDGENRHLSENDGSFLVLLSKKETIQYKSHRYSYKNREEPYERENVRENNGGMERSEKNIREKECKKSSQEPRCNASKTGESDGNDIHFCGS